MSKKVQHTPPTDILVLDNKPLNHFIINDRCRKLFPEANIIHSYSTEEAIEKITLNESSLLVLLSISQDESNEFYDAFERLPPQITEKCRIVVFKPYSNSEKL